MAMKGDPLHWRQVLEGKSRDAYFMLTNQQKLKNHFGIEEEEEKEAIFSYTLEEIQERWKGKPQTWAGYYITIIPPKTAELIANLPLETD